MEYEPYIEWITDYGDDGRLVTKISMILPDKEMTNMESQTWYPEFKKWISSS